MLRCQHARFPALDERKFNSRTICRTIRLPSRKPAAQQVRHRILELASFMHGTEFHLTHQIAGEFQSRLHEPNCWFPSFLSNQLSDAGIKSLQSAHPVRRIWDSTFLNVLYVFGYVLTDSNNDRDQFAMLEVGTSWRVSQVNLPGVFLLFIHVHVAKGCYANELALYLCNLFGHCKPIAVPLSIKVDYGNRRLTKKRIQVGASEFCHGNLFHSPFGIQGSSLLTSAFAEELTGMPQKSKKGPRFLLAILE